MTASALSTRTHALFLCAAVILSSAIVFLPDYARAQAAVATDPSSTIDELAAIKVENVRLRGLIPSQSHAMMDVSFHFTISGLPGRKKIGHWRNFI